MARIRSIKPEFPHSQSMGNISRECRLFFILLWTLSDDLGKLRANSRLLASLLYPYDKDIENVDKWLEELVSEKCITCYRVDSHEYIKIINWSVHQKIDKPSKSKIPDPPDNLSNQASDSINTRESSRDGREESSGDRRIVGSEDQGSGNGSGSAAGDPAQAQSNYSGFKKIFEEGTKLFPDLIPKNASSIHSWINAGFDVELDILPELQRNAGGDPKSWNYFSAMIADAYARRNAPPPVGKAESGDSKPGKPTYRDKIAASNLETNKNLARKYAEN